MLLSSTLFEWAENCLLCIVKNSQEFPDLIFEPGVVIIRTEFTHTYSAEAIVKVLPDVVSFLFGQADRAALAK